MKHLLELDLIGQKPEISINHKPTYQTYLGTILSIFILFITFYSCKDLFEQYIQRTYPQESINYIKNNDKIDFHISNLPILIQFIYFDPSKTVNFEIALSEFNLTKQKSPQLKGIEFDSDKINITGNTYLKTCNITYIDSYLKELNDSDPELFKLEYDFLKEYRKKARNSFCFDQKKEEVESFHIRRDDNSKGRYMILQFSSKLDEFIKSTVRNEFILSFVSINYPKYYLSASEKQKQYTKDLDFILFPIVNTVEIYFYEIFFNTFDIISDYSEFFVENQKEIRLHSIDSTIFKGSLSAKLLEDANEKYNCLFLIMNMNKNKKIYNYKYLGLTDIISNLGGSFEIYFLFVSLIHQVLSAYHYKAFLINSTFSFHQTNQTNPQINKNNILKLRKPITDLDKKKLLVEDLVKGYINSKEKLFISAKDVVYSSFRRIFNTQTEKDRIIEKCLVVLEEQYDYTNIIKILLDDYVYKDLILDSSVKKFLNFPSINLSKQGFSIGVLNKIMRKREEIDYEDVMKLLKKEKNRERYLRIFEFYMEKE